MAIVTMDSQGKIAIPKSIRDHLEIGPGDDVSIRVLRDGRLVVEKHHVDLKIRMAGEPERSVLRTGGMVRIKHPD